MKTLGARLISLLVLWAGSLTVSGQPQRSEVPGDNFSLEGALELFKRSKSPQEFEKLLNSKDGKVNNLDLNGDDQIDYIRVIDTNEGNVHAFILRAVVSENESQDVAVIELEKLSNGKAVLQITGDSDVYGVETIIEPTEEVSVMAGTSTARTVVNVWTWPVVQYVYDPYYTVWVSPWGWYYRPIWWSPWTPVAYYVYYPYWSYSRPYYSVCYSHRVVYAPRIYRPYRSTSVIVYNRHKTQLVEYRSRPDVRQRGQAVRYSNRSNVRPYQQKGEVRQRSHIRERSSSDVKERSKSHQERMNKPSNSPRQRAEPAYDRSKPNREFTPVKSDHKRVGPAPNIRRDNDLSQFRSRGSSNSSPRQDGGGSPKVDRGRSMGNQGMQPRPGDHGRSGKSGGGKKGKN
jgi:hypothetical protein